MLKVLWLGVSLGVLLGKLRKGTCLQGTVRKRKSGRRAMEIEHIPTDFVCLEQFDVFCLWAGVYHVKNSLHVMS